MAGSSKGALNLYNDESVASAAGGLDRPILGIRWAPQEADGRFVVEDRGCYGVAGGPGAGWEVSEGN